MWLMDERQKVSALETAVQLTQHRIKEISIELQHIQEDLTRRKDALVTLEARVQRMEQIPSIQARRKVPVTTVEPSSAPLQT